MRKVCRGVDERGSRRGAQQLGDHFESSIQFAVHDVRWNVELVGEEQLVDLLCDVREVGGATRDGHPVTLGPRSCLVVQLSRGRHTRPEDGP